MKLASGTVRDTADPHVLSTDLDTFGGNSGSPVFSLVKEAGSLVPQLEGLLITGEEDDYVAVDGCVKPLMLSNGGGVGAGVQRITAFIDRIPGL
jgi:hypothetical protein